MPVTITGGWKLTEAAVEQFTVGERYRKDLGDIDQLARSIEEVGQLQPIISTIGGELIAGQRRLEACRLIGRSVRVIYVEDVEDALRLRCEQDENTCRKDFSPLEAKALADVLIEIETKAAKERQRSHGGTAPGKSKNTSVPGTEVSEGRAKDRAAKGSGLGGRRAYDNLDKIQKHPETTPEDLQRVDTGAVKPKTLLRELDSRTDEQKAPKKRTDDKIEIHLPSGTELLTRKQARALYEYLRTLFEE